MATTLQRQLAALADPASTLLNPERRRVSIIFTSQEAAKFDKETFYQIGLDGLNDLISIAPDLFLPFQNSILFSNAFKHFERAVEDAATNDQVDKLVDKFLITLSPYLMIKASLKCMEWLVYRFHIERFNIESIIECIMPYYDTKHFVMIIQILQFGNARSRVTVDWEWLTPCIKSTTVLRKATLFGNVNAPFIIWLFQTLRKFLEVHQSHPDNLSTFLGFMVSTIVGIVTKFSREFSMKREYQNIRSKSTVIDVILSQLHALFEEILTKNSFEMIRNNREVYSVAYVIIATIGVAAEENPEIGGILGSKIKRIFNLLIKNRHVALLEETYLLIDLLVHHIYFEWTFKRPKPFLKAMNDLSLISEKWDVSKVVTRLMLANACEEDILNPKLIFHLLSEIQLPPETRAEILSKIYFMYKGKGTKKGYKWANLLLARFEKQYPSEFEMACKTDGTFADDLTNAKQGKNFLLLIDHPDDEVRANAVRKMLVRATTTKTLQKGVSKKPAVNIRKTLVPDQNQVASALIPKFSDESQLVICSLLKHKLKLLLKVFSAQTLVHGCISIAKNNKGVKSVRLAIKKLCALAVKSNVNEQLKKQILKVLIPYLFPRKTSGILTAKKIAFSEFAKENKILQEYQSLKKTLPQITPEEFCRHSYKVLITLDDKSLISDLNHANAVDLTIALLLTRDETDFIELLDAACMVGMQSTSDFPVKPDSFSKCLLIAEKHNRISLELILSSILKTEITTTIDTQLSILKFVWAIGETESNRSATLKFCKRFLKKIYPDPIVQFWFWLTALRVTSTLEESNQCDFYVIRCLQFFTKFVSIHGIPARMDSTDSSESETQKTSDPHRPLTRSQGTVKEVNLTSSRVASSKLSQAHDDQLRQSKDRVSPTWCLLEVVFSKCIQHPSQVIRSLCVKFLKVIRKVPKLSVDWEELLGKVLPFSKEIVADSRQAPVVVGRVIVDANLSSAKSHIIRALHSENTDQEVFIGLVNICQHTGSMIYSELEPLISKLLETDIESQQLQALLNCYEASMKSVEILPKLLQSKSCAKTILRKFNGRFLKSVDSEFRKQLFSIIIESAVVCKIPEIKLGIQRCVQKWELESSLISDEIKKCMSAERRNAANLAISKQKKLQEQSSKGNDETDWKGRTEVVLEFLQGMKKLTDKKLLLAPLFRVLKLCISLEEQSPVEYLKQLTLTALTLCCEEDGEDQADSGTFHVELVIRCLQCSRNPQTHHHALILLNYASKRFHEQVLHGVMDLFIYMGDSILRQDDTYSTQLIQQTVTTIIPALTKAGKGSNPQFSRTVVSSGIFRVFASALQDIPVHRRLPVFSSLVETLDPEECLWQVLIIIVDNALNRDRKRSNLNADLELATDLAWSCEPSTVLSSLAKVYEFFNALSQIYQTSVSENDFKNLQNVQPPVVKAVLDFTRKETYRDVQLVIHYTLELILKIATKFADVDVNDVKLKYDTVLERCLSFSRIVSGLSEDKIFRHITHKNFEVVEKINAVLEVEEFVGVVSGILERNDFTIKRKILDMLNLRLAQKIEWFGDLKILLGLLDPLLKVATLDPVSEEVVTLIQTAFLALKLIAKHLAFSHPEEFVTVFTVALSCVSHEKHLLCASALLCMGELFCLKSLLLPKLNVVTSAILRALKTSSKLHGVSLDAQIASEESSQNSNDDMELDKVQQDLDNSLTSAHLLCISTIACMNKMAEQLGSFMGAKFLKRALILILKIDSHISLGDIGGTRKKTFDQRLRVLLKTVATKVPVRNSLLPFKGAFHSLIDKPRATKAIMFSLKESLQATSKPDFGLILPSLCDSFIEEFLACREYLYKSQDLSDLDEVLISKKNQEIALVEDSVIDCFISGAVLKMSEGTFRPYYHKLFDWARDNDPRLITFYRFSAGAAERLKSLFVTFAGYIMNEAVNCLNRNVELTKGILSLFYHLFCNDREGFVTTDRFNAVVKPLVDLLESDFILNGHIELKILSDTLIQLAVASNDLNRWQHMIDLISSKTHSSNRKVRLNVVSTLESAATELGKDFLPLLPPVVPFLAELMNDDEPEVESATHKMLLKLEDIVGEPLQPYFT